MNGKILALYKRKCTPRGWARSSWKDVTAFEAEIKAGIRNARGNLKIPQIVRRAYG